MVNHIFRSQASRFALVGLALLILASPAGGGPVVLGGDDTTDHGGSDSIPLPGTGVTVAESEPNDTFATADPIDIGDDYTGRPTATTAAGTGVTVNESEPNNDSSEADPINVGDDYMGAVPVSQGAASGVTVDESEPNDDSGTADAVNVGDDIQGELPLILDPLTGNTVPESEPNNTSGTSDTMDLGGVYTGSITPMNDVDIVEFTVTGPTTIQAGLLSNFDSRLALLDTNGIDELADADDSSGLFSEEILFDLPGAGTYFLVVDSCCPGGDSGTYSLELYSVQTHDEEDFFTFTVGGAGTFVATATLAGASNASLEVREPDGMTVITQETVGSIGSNLFFELPGAGTYFLRIRRTNPTERGNTVGYTLELRTASFDPVDLAGFTLGVPTIVAAEFEIFDPVLASSSQVILSDGFPFEFLRPGDQVLNNLAAGDHVTGVSPFGFGPPRFNTGGAFKVAVREVTSDDNIDIVSFTVGPGNVLVRVEGPVGLTVEVIDTDESTVLSGAIVEPNGTAQIEVPLPVAGTYFLRITREEFFFGVVITGDYTIELRGDSGADGPTTGWEYIQRALAAMEPLVTRGGNDGSVAAIGSEPSNATSDNAGAAIGVAAGEAGLPVTYYNGATAIQDFFDDLMAGLENPAIIWIAGDEADNDLDDAEGAVVTANAEKIADFVKSGGGVMAHGAGPRAYGWLPALLPGATEIEIDQDRGAAFTPEGFAFLPGVTDDQINDGPWHGYFIGDFGPLQVLAESTDFTDQNGQPVAIIIGGNFPDPVEPQPEPGPIEPGTDVICGTGTPNLDDDCIEVCVVGGGGNATLSGTSDQECLGTSGTDEDGDFCVELDRPLDAGEQIVIRDNCGGLSSPVIPVASPAPAPAMSLLGMLIGLASLMGVARARIKRART